MSAGEDIAVTGLALRLPGATDPAAFLANLAAGHSAIRPLPEHRWPLADHHDPNLQAAGKIYTDRAGTIDDVAGFDRRLFGLSPHDARAADPQHRLLLEVAWEALELAGVAPAGLSGEPVGVFVGLSSVDYWLLQANAGYPAAANPYVATGGAMSVAAGRIAYCLGLTGPAIAVDTACSASLMALTLACENLLRGEVPMAVVAGVNLILSPDVMASLCRMRVLAPDGTPRPFGAGAAGYARGEGCVAVVLKTLAQAKADGDTIHAVVKGWASNHNGRTNGLSAPSASGQARAITAALARAGVAPADVGYVEAHGSATPLGDTIEMSAMAEVFGGRDPATPLRIGTVKAAVGHLEGGAGLAGFAKAVLMVRHGVLPAQPPLGELSQGIPWAELPIRVQTATEPWGGGARIAGVNASGFSGTNVHVVVAEPPLASTLQDAETDGPVLIALSAATPAALGARAAALAAMLRAEPERPLAAVARATARTWTGLACADAVVAATTAEAAAGLDAIAASAPARQAPRRGVVRRRISLTDCVVDEAALAAAFPHIPPGGEGPRALLVALCEAAELTVADEGDFVLAVGTADAPEGARVVRVAEGGDPVRALLEALAELVRLGAAVDPRGLLPPGAMRVALPPYPFQHERFWFDDV